MLRTDDAATTRAEGVAAGPGTVTGQPVAVAAAPAPVGGRVLQLLRSNTRLVLPVLPGSGDSVNEVVSALRPNAMVLVVLKDVADVPEVLSALRV